jgi:hypothetical protein
MAQHAPRSFATTVAREKDTRAHLREARSAAHAVLMNREILTVHALAVHEVQLPTFS